MELTLDEITHQYRLGDQPVLGVSHILEAAAITDKRWVTEEGLLRGTHIHSTVELHVKNDLDESRLDPRLHGYLAAWKAFERESGFKVDQVEGVWQCEVKRHHPLYRYAGKIDLIGSIGGRRFVIDLKSGDPDVWHGFQLAGYAMLEEGNGSRQSARRERANVYVRPDGVHRFVERRDRNDFEVFKAALTIARTRIAMGLAL